MLISNNQEITYHLDNRYIESDQTFNKDILRLKGEFKEWTHVGV